MYLCKKRHQPRYKTMMKIDGLKSMLTKMQSIIEQLKKDKAASESELKALQNDMDAAKRKIKVSCTIRHLEFHREHGLRSKLLERKSGVHIRPGLSSRPALSTCPVLSSLPH